MNTIVVYLVSISLLIAVSVVVLRIPVRRDYLQKGRLRIGTAVLQALIFFAFGGFPIIYLSPEWPISHVHPIIWAAGLLSLTIGIAVIFVSMFRLGILRSLGLQTGTLQETHLYQLSRNPQVLGCALYVLGFIILWPSLYALGWGLSLMVILHVMVLTEEENLRNAYGQDYEQYCKSVPRYLGIPKIPG